MTYPITLCIATAHGQVKACDLLSDPLAIEDWRKAAQDLARYDVEIYPVHALREAIPILASYAQDDLTKYASKDYALVNRDRAEMALRACKSLSHPSNAQEVVA